MTHRHDPFRRALRTLAVAAVPVLLAACGGGDSDAPSYSCSLSGEKSWLRDYFGESYFWYQLSPSPSPAGYDTLDSYFQALLYGGGAEFPADRYSYYESTESFNRFFGDGRTLGYGLFVAGVEVEDRPDLPLRVRYIEPQSDAAAKGLLRGDEIVSVNGRPASELIAANDYAALSPQDAGDTLALVVRNADGDRSLTLTATEFALTPVAGSSIVTSPLGRRMGYVMVKDMIDQARSPLDTAFAQFKSQGVADVVLDLRYNGGGLVSVGRTLASYVSAGRTAGQEYVRLLYNDRLAADYNETYRFDDPAAALGLSRVYVLSGPRTCSASEQVINALRPFVEVIAIGDTTCGKPVGFLPTPNCGNTYSVVNFESANADNEGRYFDGFAPSCSVADDLDHALGSPNEGLLAAARQHADTGACPVASQRAQPMMLRRPGGRTTEPGDRQGMYPD